MEATLRFPKNGTHQGMPTTRKRIEDEPPPIRIPADLGWRTVTKLATAVVFAGTAAALFAEWIAGPRAREDSRKLFHEMMQQQRPLIREEATRASERLIDRRLTTLREELEGKYDRLLIAIESIKDERK